MRYRVAALMALCVSSVANGASKPLFIAHEILVSGQRPTSVTGLNDVGQIVGTDENLNAFVFDVISGQKIYLVRGNSRFDFPHAINNNGLVIGEGGGAILWNSATNTRSFITSPRNGNYRINNSGSGIVSDRAWDFKTISQMQVNFAAPYSLYDLNDNGIATFVSYTNAGTGNLYNFNTGQLISFDDKLSPSNQKNDLGAIVINNFGLTAGAIFSAGWTRPFVYDLNSGSMSDISLKNFGYGYSYSIRDINDLGQVLFQLNGVNDDRVGILNGAIAAYWDARNGSFAFNDVTLGVDGFSIEDALAINEQGQVLVVASRPSQDSVYFLLDPISQVPEPGAWAMLIAGFMGVGLALRQLRTASA